MFAMCDFCLDVVEGHEYADHLRVLHPDEYELVLRPSVHQAGEVSLLEAA